MKKFLVILATVLAGVLFVGGIGAVSSISQEEPPVLAATLDGTTMDTPNNGTLPHATLDLSVYPNSSDAVPPPKEGPYQSAWLSGQPFYHPSTTIQVPANSVVTINFTQYDSGGQIYNPFFAHVHGTMDGTMDWNGKSVKDVKSDSVGHTFTVHQFPESSQPYFFLSVPLPMNAANAKTDKSGYPVDPQKISVTFVTGEAGTYVWNCEFPCGDEYQEFGGPMQTRGWMAGTFEVVA